MAHAASRTMRTLCTGVIAMILLFGLTACGSSNTPPAPAVTAVTAQPTDQSVVAGTTATFTVVATDASGYQWQSSADGGANFSDVSGATSAGYITAVTLLADSGTQYRVVVSGASTTVTSSAVTLTVTPVPVAPGISVHPANQTITEGQNASFSVTASGTSLNYQWQRSTNGGASFTNMGGATSATLALTAVPLADNTHRFRVAVSNTAGSVTSDAALLTVSAAPSAPAFTSHPASISVLTPNTATFSATVTGTPTTTLQWQLSTNAGGSFTDIAGATAASYTTPGTSAGDDGNQYRVIATNASGATTSNAATLTVAVPAAPSFTAHPANQAVTEPATATFSATVTGTPTTTLQWQLSTNSGSTWSNINGATAASYTTPATVSGDSGRQYRAVASNSVGTTNSSAATLTVTAASASLSIVFYRTNGTQGDLYLVKEDGSGQVALAETADNEFFGAVAPDGRLIYHRTVNGQTDLYSVKFDGSDMQILANSTDIEDFKGITATGRVIYRRDSATTGRDLWSVNADGTNPQALAITAGNEDFRHITSGGKIIYSVQAGSNQTDLYSINPDGTGNAPLATDPFFYEGIAGETPTGQIIIATIDSNLRGMGSIYSLNGLGGAATTLATNTVAFEYAFVGITRTGQVMIRRTVNGQHDLYGGTTPLATSTDSETYQGSTADGRVIYRKTVNNQYDLYIVNADGSNAIPLTNTASPEKENFQAMTPDGRVVYGKETNNLYDIYIVNTDGSNTVPVATSVDYEVYKGMTADGHLIYERTTNGITYLYAYNTNNGVTTPLVTSGGHARFIAVTPNNKVLFERISGQADLHIINTDGTGSTPLANTGNNEYFAAAF